MSGVIRCPCGGWAYKLSALPLNTARLVEPYLGPDDYYCVDEDDVLTTEEVLRAEKRRCPAWGSGLPCPLGRCADCPATERNTHMNDSPKPLSAVEIIEKARDLIEDPERWAQWSSALDANNETVAAVCESAVRWCASGALRKVANLDNLTERDAYRNAWDALWKHGDIVDVNDMKGHEATLEFFDKVLADLKQGTPRGPR